METMPFYTQEYQAWLMQLATENIARGVIEEPRVYFDNILLDAAPLETISGSDIFKNGERFPVRLTHMMLMVNTGTQAEIDAGLLTDERLIQDVGVQLRFHDQFYMNPDFVAAPLWATQPSVSPPAVNQSTASWRFVRPVIFSARDTLQVDVQLITPAVTATPVNVTFTGVGVSSKRPYFLNGQIALFDGAVRTIPTDNFRNDGAEPILITDMVVNIAGALGSDNPSGDIRNLRIQVKQLGNGTQATWMIGPTSPSNLGVGAALLGIYTGRVIVHQFPGTGLLWEPGEGLDVVARRLSGVNGKISLGLGLAGYSVVG